MTHITNILIYCPNIGTKLQIKVVILYKKKPCQVQSNKKTNLTMKN